MKEILEKLTSFNILSKEDIYHIERAINEIVKYNEICDKIKNENLLKIYKYCIITIDTLLTEIYLSLKEINRGKNLKEHMYKVFDILKYYINIAQKLNAIVKEEVV